MESYAQSLWNTLIDFAGDESAHTLTTFDLLVDAGALRVRNVT